MIQYKYTYFKQVYLKKQIKYNYETVDFYLLRFIFPFPVLFIHFYCEHVNILNTLFESYPIITQIHPKLRQNNINVNYFF